MYLSFYLSFMAEATFVSLVSGIMWALLVFTHSPITAAVVMAFGTWFFLSACWGIALVFRCAWSGFGGKLRLRMHSFCCYGLVYPLDSW